MARIVFDLDGTLIDSAPDIHGIANMLLEQEKKPGITLLQTREFIGNGAAVFVQRLRDAAGIDDSEHVRVYNAFVAAYNDAVTLTEIYPGVVEALEALRAAGHSLGICTNKPIQPCKSVLQHLDLEKYFDTVWGGDSLTVHKPDPTPLHAAFDALPVGPRLYVGDSEVDAETAERAIVPFLLYTNGYRKSPVARIPHRAAFDNFADLPALVEQTLVVHPAG